ncbi:MAG: exonuclease domain-containing protein [Phycisphaerales bacterium]
MQLSFGIKINDDGTIEIIEDISTGKTLNQRTEKGESLTVLSSDYTIIDIETTGLDPHFDEIIELSAIRVRNKQKHDMFQSLVHPMEEVSSFISGLTGITNEMLSSAPTIETIFPSFLEFVGDDVVVGHNVHFDVNFIYDVSMEVIKRPFTNNLMDTMRIARKLFPDVSRHTLYTLAEHFKLPVIPTHRAMTDCEAVFSLYQVIDKYLSDNHLDLPALFKKKNNYSHITTQNTVFNEDHPLYKKHCVFTGALERMIRRDAMQIVVDLGGSCSDSVTKKTNFLVLGNLDYCKTIKDGQSSKLKKAQSLILNGSDLQIISEDTFYSLISSN